MCERSWQAIANNSAIQSLVRLTTQALPHKPRRQWPHCYLWACDNTGSAPSRGALGLPHEALIVTVGANSSSTQDAMKRLIKEFSDFFFTKGNVLPLAIAVVVGDQASAITKSLSKDLLMPLINPLIPHGSYKDLVIPYFGGPIAIGQVLDTFVSALLVAWVLFLMMKAVKRVERLSQRDNTPAD